jgi:transcriptional regulator with XRE-family HTH domain
MTMNAERLGRAIAEVRRLRGLTQRQVADRAALTVNYISYVEHGARNVTLEALNKIAKALRVPVQWIQFLAGQPPKKGEASQELIDLDRATRESIRELLAAEAEVGAG